MEPDPVLDDETKALIDGLIASTLEYFANENLSTEWNPALGPSQIGLTYHDYEDPLTSYERELLEDPFPDNSQESWGPVDVCFCLPFSTTGLICPLYCLKNIRRNIDPDSLNSQKKCSSI